MRFEEEDDHAFCQCGNGLVGFEGVRYQKGFGLFGNIFRWALPYLKQFGTYVGKKLFHFGTDVVKDVALDGKSIKESAKQRFKEGKDQMLEDGMAKLKNIVQGGRGRRRRRTKKINKRSCKPVNLKSKQRKVRRKSKKSRIQRPKFSFLQ